MLNPYALLCAEGLERAVSLREVAGSMPAFYLELQFFIVGIGAICGFSFGLYL